MRNISVPETVEAYRSDIATRAFPDPMLVGNDFYRGLIDWVCETHTPLLYEQTHEDEYANFSINFNWLLLRDYQDTAYGHPDTIKTMYGIHEFSHMTHRLPVDLDNTTVQGYANDFTASEYRASNETEILIHYRVPELRKQVFPDTKIAFDMLKERGVPQPSSVKLSTLRAQVIEGNERDECFMGSVEDQKILARLKGYGGNREWAAERFNRLQARLPTNLGQARPDGLDDNHYETGLPGYSPNLDQASYEANVVRNIKFGYAMCGLAIPRIKTFKQALEAMQDLEGQHAIV